MQEDKMIVDVPVYHVEYTETEYGYRPGRGRDNLKKALLKASHDYCMYCHTRIRIDGNQYGHLEHAIEKSFLPEKLENCVPNIGIACSTCNDKYKRYGEKNRKPQQKDLQEFKECANCSSTYCNTTCAAYDKLKRAYLKRRESQFLMQPQGVTSYDLGIEEKRELSLQYDILQCKYIPSCEKKYTDYEINFLNHHIAMFGLNSKQRKTTQLKKFLQDTIEKDGNFSKIEYNSQIVELFVEQVLKGRNQEEILKICRTVYTYQSILFR